MRLACAFKFDRSRRFDLAFRKYARNPTRPISLSAKLENHFYDRRGFLVNNKAAVLALDIPVRGVRADTLARHSLVVKHGADLLAGVFGIPFIRDV